jgi:AGCS family alanine or glycine:cation symporter
MIQSTINRNALPMRSLPSFGRTPLVWSFLLMLLLSGLPLGSLHAQDAAEAVETAPTLDERINSVIQPATDAIVSVIFFTVPIGGASIPFVLIWLIVGAIFFTLRFKFVNLRRFKLAIDVVRGKYDDPNEPGEVSHFQALTAALSGTVGLGNIAGVAIAISLGGPGATFWMILAGLFGMSTKFVECTLGVKFRTIDPDDGEVRGGPMYYLSRGIKERFGGSAFGTFLGSGLAFLAALMIIGGSFGGGNMFQINQAASQFTSVTGLLVGQTWVVGMVMAVLVGIVILGGIRSIANVTDKIVPVMVGVYVLAALFVIFGNIGKVGWAFNEIFSGAFQAQAIYGGFIGVLIQGFKRAAFSNEAGVGSASIAHSAVKTDQPASEGIVALLEPFIDTVVVCTMTALVIVITGEYQNFSGDTSTAAGVSLTSAAFQSVIGWFPYVLMAAVVLFAFSTMITWSYYGMTATKYLFGDSKLVEYGYKLIFCLLVVAGSTMELGAVVDFSDAMILGMAFPNILGLYILFPFVQEELDRYLRHLGIK